LDTFWAIFSKTHLVALERSQLGSKLSSAVAKWNYGGIIKELSRAKSYFHFYWADQGCQMVCFQTKKSQSGKKSRAPDWKILMYVLYDRLENVMAIWDIL
jgi:hypothetical protein